MLGTLRRGMELTVEADEVEEVNRKVGLAERKSFGGMMRISQVD